MGYITHQPMGVVIRRRTTRTVFCPILQLSNSNYVNLDVKFDSSVTTEKRSFVPAHLDCSQW